ncbi:MAG: hypothetical protein AAF915_17155 [Cyanobacteria bacterium P01_D01_bin.50]
MVKPGFLMQPDSVAGLIEVTKRLSEINCKTCRNAAQREFYEEAF